MGVRKKKEIEDCPNKELREAIERLREVAQDLRGTSMLLSNTLTELVQSKSQNDTT
jgi:hypothetical protein